MPTLEITTMIGCPLKCTFCPQDQLKAAYGTSPKYLSVDTFRTVLAKIPLHVRIDFSGMSEPWANPHATEMLCIALERGYRVAIYTTLYNMSVEDSLYITTELLPQHASQVEIICIHLPDESGNMRGYKPSAEYREVLSNFITFANMQNEPAIPISAMTMDRAGRVHESLSDVIYRLPNWQGHSRAGSLGHEQIQATGAMIPPKHDFPLQCAKTPFYDQNVLFPDGSVALCCMDYNRKHILGNLSTDDYWGLFSSDELTKLRIINQKPGYNKCSICKSCERAVQPKEIPAII